MQIGTPNQISAVERRVAITPDVASRLAKQGFSVVVESGAGVAAGFPDHLFEEAGATISDAAAAWGAELVVCYSAPTEEQIGLLRRGGILLGLLEPLEPPQVEDEEQQRQDRAQREDRDGRLPEANGPTRAHRYGILPLSLECPR